MPYGVLALSLAGLFPAALLLAAIGANTYWFALAVRLEAMAGAALVG